jgi:hypothetical protein
MVGMLADPKLGKHQMDVAEGQRVRTVVLARERLTSRTLESGLNGAGSEFKREKGKL